MRAVFLLVMIAVAGCSAMTMPSAHAVQTSWVPCSTTSAAPGVDAALAILGGAAALGGLATFIGNATAENREPDDDESHAIMALGGAGLLVTGLLVAIPYGASSRHGSRSADACAARAGRP